MKKILTIIFVFYFLKKDIGKEDVSTFLLKTQNI